MNYLGVDIGLSGGITLTDNDGNILICESMPTNEIVVNKKKKNQYDIQEIYSLLVRIKADYEGVKAAVERLRAIPNQSSQTGFSLGYGQAIFRTLFTVLDIACEDYEPAQWQKQMFKGVNYDKKTTKIASVMVAKKLSPMFCFRASERCRTDSDGLTDSFLIARYLRLVDKNLIQK